VARDADRHRRKDDGRGRIKRILPYLGDDKEFCLTYGDGVGDINVPAAVDLHRKEGRLATVTATQPPGRFGAINYQGNRVTGFQEKPMGDGGWINGGFFVLSPQVGRYIKDDATVWSRSRCRSSPRRTSSEARVDLRRLEKYLV
jgi:glucose-1-phosphate cytidylyltransferase